MVARHRSDDHYYYLYLAFPSLHNPSIPPFRTYRHFLNQHIERIIAIMPNNARYYYSLPTEAPARSRSGTRRPPLTPSTVSSPCLTTLVSLPRRDSASSSSPTKAHALLAKVVSSPTTSRGENPPRSASSSPTESRPDMYHQSASYSYESPTGWRNESDRYVRQYRQQGEFHVNKGFCLPYANVVQMDTSLSQTLRSSARTRMPTNSTVSIRQSRLEQTIL